jgi:hypothetical protein
MKSISTDSTGGNVGSHSPSRGLKVAICQHTTTLWLGTYWWDFLIFLKVLHKHDQNEYHEDNPSMNRNIIWEKNQLWHLESMPYKNQLDISVNKK